MTNRNTYRNPARRKEIAAILLLAFLLNKGKKKGHGGPHGPPAPPPPDVPPPPDPPPPGGGDPSALNASSIGKYVPSGHPFTDRVPTASLPTDYVHTQYGFDTDGVA